MGHSGAGLFSSRPERGARQDVSAVNVASMSYADHENDELRIMDLVDDAKVSDADPISFFDLEYGASRRTGIAGEGVDNRANPDVYFPVELSELLCGCRSIVNPIGHGAHPVRP